MKLTKWIFIIFSILIVAWALFSIDKWASDWKGLFFYQDNWIFYGFVVVMVFAVSGIIQWILKTEVKILK
ncbi:MAG: hypothetical protein WCW13_05255 [archaeon]